MSVGWAVLGTAGIARSQFLPALADTGGRAVVVGGRDGERARAYAAANGVEAGVAGYEAAIAHPDVDAVYVALPNSMHAEWTAAALSAGKAVLCEKPLCTSAAETRTVLDSAGPDALLWEAFVFPFAPQFERAAALVADGAIGDLQEVESSFHFALARQTDIRLSAGLGGGALADVGCYPLRLAQLLFGAGPTAAVATEVRGAEVNIEMAALCRYPADRLLRMSCGFRRPYDTHTRLLGSAGSVMLTNPFHPQSADSLTLRRPGADPVTERLASTRSFVPALQHVAGVLDGAELPRHRAINDSMATARGLELVTASL